MDYDARNCTIVMGVFLDAVAAFASPCHTIHSGGGGGGAYSPPSLPGKSPESTQIEQLFGHVM